MDYSRYQQAIFEWAKTGTGHAVVDAVAGSGKTTTLVELMKIITGRTQFLAFNKHTAEALAAKAPMMTSVSTLNSFGNGLIRAYNSGASLDKFKTGNILKDMMPYKDYLKCRNQVQQVVSLVKAAYDGLSLYTIDSIVDEHGIVFPNNEKYNYIEICGQVFKECLAEKSTYDFDDQIFWPVYFGYDVPKIKNVLVDEAQDLSPVQLELVAKMLGPDSRLVAVGDPHQCQPAGTMIMTQGQGRPGVETPDPVMVPIENITTWHQVCSMDERDLVAKNAVLQTANRPYSGNMYTIKAGGFETRCTPNHKWRVKFDSDIPFVTYLMRVGNRFRIGQTVGFRKSDNCGVAERGRQERASEAWILAVHATLTESRIYETVLSVRYGIPTTCFYPQNAGTTYDYTHGVFETLGDLTENALKCLRDHGRLLEYPFWSSHSNKTQGLHYSFVTETCNLLSGLMKVPVVRGKITQKSKPDWETLTFEVNHFEGQVYSLDIEKHHKYIADGIVTMNSIYRFRGAGIGSIDKIIKRFDAAVLPLSVCYRCPKAVVKEAQTLVPHIEVCETAEEGEVKEVKIKDWLPLAGDLVLCRTTAPLVKECLAGIREGRRGTVKGRDIGEGLNKLADNATLKEDDTDLSTLRQYRALTLNKMKHASDEALMSVTDQIDTLQAIIEYAENEGKRWRNVIKDLFSDDRSSGILYSTIHRSKGLEYPNVHIIRPDLIPHPKCSGEENLKQEHNLKYVAITRAMKSLTWVAGE